MNAEQEAAYWALVESFIAQANEASAEQDLGLINGALMQAAARFNAFYVAASSESRKDLKEDVDGSIRDFGSEYKRLLSENFDDYVENYKVYMREEDEEA